MTVGLETSTDTAQLIAPAGVAGVVGLKPTVGLVSRTGVLPVARSQDSPGPISADGLRRGRAAAGDRRRGPGDPATAGAPAPPDYLAGLVPTALSGKRVAVIASTAAPYPAAVARAPGARRHDRRRRRSARRARTRRASSRASSSATSTPTWPALAASAAKSLQEIIDYNNANPVEGLKYQQGQLIAAQAVDLSDPATAAAYEADKTAGKAVQPGGDRHDPEQRDAADTSDDFDVIMVPSGNAPGRRSPTAPATRS